MRIYFIRHAKTEALAPRGDKARCLTERGKSDARLMREILWQKGDFAPNFWLVSTATRAMQTAQILAGVEQNLFENGAEILSNDGAEILSKNGAKILSDAVVDISSESVKANLSKNSVKNSAKNGAKNFTKNGAEISPQNRAKIIYDERLYTFDGRDLLGFVRELLAKIKTSQSFGGVNLAQLSRQEKNSRRLSGKSFAEISAQSGNLRHLDGKNLSDFMVQNHAQNFEETLVHLQIAIVSHNYAITEVCKKLSGAHIGEMPTCSVCAINFTGTDIATAKLLYFHYPKEFY